MNEVVYTVYGLEPSSPFEIAPYRMIGIVVGDIQSAKDIAEAWANTHEHENYRIVESEHNVYYVVADYENSKEYAVAFVADYDYYRTLLINYHNETLKENLPLFVKIPDWYSMKLDKFPN